MTYGNKATIKQKASLEPGDLPDTSTTSELDDTITTLQEQAASAIERFCQRDFTYHQGDTIKIDGNDRETIRLGVYPVINVTEVKLDDEVISSDEYRVQDMDYGIYENAGILERKDDYWYEGWENLEVTLDWGYQDPPPEIVAVEEDLVVDAVASIKKNESAPGVESQSMDGYSVTYQDLLRGSGEGSEAYQERLKPFRRIPKA